MTIQKAYPFTFPVTMNMFTIECQGETRDYCIQFYTKLRAD